MDDKEIMRIIFLSRNAREADAIGRHLSLKIRLLLHQGHQVSLIVSDSTRLIPDLVSITSTYESARELWKCPSARERLLSADLICVEFGGYSHLFDLLPRLSARKKRILADYHGITPVHLVDDALRDEQEKAIEQRQLLAFADILLCHSAFAQRELQEALQVPQDRIQVLPCAWKESLTYSVEDLSSLRKEGSRYVLFVGRLAQNKRFPVLLEAFARLVQSPEFADLELVCVGQIDDIYASELKRCQEQIRALNLSDRVRFTGQVSDVELAKWYRAASVLVLPSAHECFGIPVLEAMSAGTPVIVSDAGSLPEIVGHAGKVFPLDQPDALASCLKEVLAVPANWLELGETPKQRVAIVTTRYGEGILGGAELSQRIIAKSLKSHGHPVTIFTTCNRDMSRWGNHFPAGRTMLDDIPVHRFPIDPVHQESLDQAYQEIVEAEGNVPRSVEEKYLAHSLSSSTLLQELELRQNEFDVILAGPYLFRLTKETAERFPDKCILIPCFHHEPLAYLKTFKEVYSRVAGLLFHSQAEAKLTANQLGIRNPRNGNIGTLLSSDACKGNTEAGRNRIGSPYVVYCGRYCVEKGIDTLLQSMEVFQRQHSNQLKLICMGQGPYKLPKAPWLVDLGFVSEEKKRDILAGSLALVHLSQQESLSIIALEAWAVKRPIMVSNQCPVLVDQIRNSGGGVAVDSPESFSAHLLKFLQNPAHANQLGTQGFEYVLKEYVDPEKYYERLHRLLCSLELNDMDALRQAGIDRARELNWERHQVAYLRFHEEPNETKFRRRNVQVQIIRSAILKNQLQLTLMIRNKGSLPLMHQGPGSLRLYVRWNQGKALLFRPSRRMMPGECIQVHQVIDMPENLHGIMDWELGWSFQRNPASIRWKPGRASEMKQPQGNESSGVSNRLQLAQLLALEKSAQLPRDYLDVTEGFGASLKRWIKKKFLNNFRKAYVDVAFRRQSRFNQQVLELLGQLLVSQDRVADLERQLKELRKHLATQTPADALPERETIRWNLPEKIA